MIRSKIGWIGGLIALMGLLTTPVGAQDAGTREGDREIYPVIFEARKRAVLSAERAGVMTRLNYDVGRSVKRGEVIGQVDTGELALRKKRGEQSLQHLNIKMENLSRLSKRGLATNEEVAEARMERDVIQTDIEIIKRQISNSYIRAPYNCVIIRRHVQPHEWVTDGKPVVDVLDPTSLRAVANIPSRLAVGLQEGDAHRFYVHDLDSEVTGTVEAVVPEVDELSNTAQVVWELQKPPADLLSGMKGEVRIVP